MSSYCVKYDREDLPVPGYELVEEHLPKGNILPAHMAAGERLLYILSGWLKVKSGTESGVVAAGDMVRVAAGKLFAREALEDSVVVDVEASRTP